LAASGSYLTSLVLFRLNRKVARRSSALVAMWICGWPGQRRQRKELHRQHAVRPYG